MQEEIIVDLFMADVPPAGLGRNPGPLTGVYAVDCSGVSRHHKHKDWFLLALTATDGNMLQSVGTTWNARIEIPTRDLVKGAIDARTADLKKCKISFERDPATIKAVTGAKGQMKMALHRLADQKGYIWWERGNPEAPDKHAQSYAHRRWLTEEEYRKVKSGEIEIQLKNTPLTGIPGQASPGAANVKSAPRFPHMPVSGSAPTMPPMGASGPHVATPPNGAGVPVTSAPVSVPAPDAATAML